MQKNNVMFDLETFGLAPGVVIRSVGAVAFDPHSDEIGEPFYLNVDRASCEILGLTVDQGTVDWWNTPKNRVAQDALLVDPVHVAEAADRFHTWFRKQGGVFIWSQGSNYDEPLWQAVCRLLGVTAPWKFYDTRDTRTAYDMGGLNPFKIRRAGTHHNAADDAMHQARCVQAAYRRLRGTA